MICGAWGGRPDKDGLEAVTNASQNLSNMPVEVMEAEHPVRVEEYAFVPDTCGAGKWRGGIGLRRSYRILAPEALLQLRTDRVVFEPYGLQGGDPGGRSRNFIEIGNRREPLPGKVTMTVPHGRADHARAGRRRRLRRPRACAIPLSCARTCSTARSPPSSPSGTTASSLTAHDGSFPCTRTAGIGHLRAPIRLPVRRRLCLRGKEGRGRNATGLACPSQRSMRLSTCELSPMAFLGGGCLSRARPVTPTRCVQRFGPADEFVRGRRWPVQIADAPSSPSS